MKIVVDAGHGGADGGATAGGVLEKHLALAYAHDLAAALRARGHGVVMTRTTDVFVPLAERARMANAHAATCFVSVHFNASTNATARGFQVIHAKPSTPGRALSDAIFKAVAPTPTSRTGVLPDDSIHTGNRRLAVLRQTSMPAALLEVDFLTNPEARQQVQQDDFRRQTMQRAADGVEAWAGILRAPPPKPLHPAANAIVTRRWSLRETIHADDVIAASTLLLQLMEGAGAHADVPRAVLDDVLRWYRENP